MLFDNNKMSLFNFFKKNETPNEQKGYYNEQKIQLPIDFAQKVMQLQMQTQFEQSCDIEVVQQLNQLYRMAIEHYSTIDAKRAQHFHRKLTALLTNPNTIDVMEKKQHQNQVKSEYHVDTTIYEKNLKKELHNFNSQSGVVVKSIIEGTAKKLQHHNRLIDKNLEKQEDSLKRRIQERSRSKKKKL